MNKTAKEMFEELGYKQDIKNAYVINYKKKDSHIYFRNYDKTIDLSTHNTNKKLPNKQLQAIIKQVEELGWNNE